MFCNPRRWLLLALIAVSAGCSRRSAAPLVERVAVLRCENLTSDISLDWLGRGFAEVLAVEMAGSPRVSVIPLAQLRSLDRVLGARPYRAPGVSAEREAALLAQANRIVSCRFSEVSGKLRLAAAVEDPATLKTVRSAVAEAPAREIFRLADEVARQLGGAARPFGTRRAEALRAYAEALDERDPAAAREDFSRAVAADPNFGGAYVAWVQGALARQDRAGAEQVLEMAKSHSSAIQEFDRLRLDLEAATLRGDALARLRTLAALAKLDPANPGLLRGLAEAAMAGRRYRDSVNYYRRALAAAPEDIALLNSLGYAQSYLGDLNGALDTLRRYQKLRPAEANPLDSQADVNFYFGRFAEAERLYLQAQQKDPNFLNGGELLKAAQARLMTGDSAGADGIFQRWAQAQAARQDPGIDYQKAQWQYLTGKRRAAVDSLAALEAKQSRGAAVLVRAQMAIWSLALGDRARARAQALEAASGMKPPAGLAAVAMFLTEPEAPPAEWAGRAARMWPEAGQAAARELAVAYALLFQKQFQAAAPLLRKLYDESNPNIEGGLPVVLAWALLGSGQYRGVIPLIGPAPLPQAAGFDAFTSLYFPRLFFLRGELAAHQGKRDEAKRNYGLFLKLAGPDAEIWGEEARARAAAGAS